MELRKQLRKIDAYYSVRVFAETYLPHHLTDHEGNRVPFGEHHAELFDMVEAPAPPDGKREIRAEPREHGKSTVMDLIVILWWLATKRKMFPVLVSDTATQAEGQMQAVIFELEENELLREDFPHLRPKLDAKNQFEKWTDTEIHLASGQMVFAAGAGKSLRGTKRHQHRPDAVIVDDLENDENVATKGQRDKLDNWFLRALMSIGTEACDFYIVGTILHYDSLIMRRAKEEKAAAEFGGSPVWNVLIKAAEDAEGNPLWPERWSRERLAAKRREIGSIAYAQEFLNDPSKREGKLFKEEWFNWYSLGNRPGNLTEFMGIDPSAGEKEQSDFIGICSVGTDREGRLYPGRVIETKLTFAQMINTIIALGEHINPARICVESNFFQKVLSQELIRRSAEEKLFLPFAEQKTIRDKVTRFMSLSALAEAGLIWLEEGNPEHQRLLDQMLEFPDGAHDDLIDAFDFAVQAARGSAGHFEGGSYERERGRAVTAGMRSQTF